MYEWLGASGTETHVYGVRDDPEVVTELDVVVHDGDTELYRRSWVVAFSPGDSPAPVKGAPSHAALVALEVGPNVWRGVWTYDSTHVEGLVSYIDQTF